jgi:hypothetical protein
MVCASGSLVKRDGAVVEFRYESLALRWSRGRGMWLRKEDLNLNCLFVCDPCCTLSVTGYRVTKMGRPSPLVGVEAGVRPIVLLLADAERHQAAPECGDYCGDLSSVLV